jgi:hypothetical protein
LEVAGVRDLVYVSNESWVVSEVFLPVDFGIFYLDSVSPSADSVFLKRLIRELILASTHIEPTKSTPRAKTEAKILARPIAFPGDLI